MQQVYTGQQKRLLDRHVSIDATREHGRSCTDGAESENSRPSPT